MRTDELQEQFDGPAECRRRHDVGHGRTLLNLVTMLTYDGEMRVLSGIQPSGTIHLGNYLGAIRTWVREQHEDAFYCVVDLHSLTLPIEPAALRQNTVECAASLLAAGIDPDKCTFFLQSEVQYHPRLSWLLECVATMGELNRMTQYKEKAEKSLGKVGLFTYPVLQAADILLYDTTHVPVGDDQRQHIELARNIAERFNFNYGDTFVVPEGTFPAAGARVMDLQQPERKMSKSVSSPLGTVSLLDSPEDVIKKVKKAVTDTDAEVRYDRKAKPGVSNLLDILAGLHESTPSAEGEKYSRYGDLKAATGDAINDVFGPIQQRYATYMADPAEVLRIMSRGAERASTIAEATYRRAATAVGLVG